MTGGNTDQWPDSIWAYQWRNLGDWDSGWLEAREFPDDDGTEYIRADLHAALIEDRDRIRAATERAITAMVKVRRIANNHGAVLLRAAIDEVLTAMETTNDQ